MNKTTTASLDDYTLFRLLCELEQGPVCSQRELARRLDSALGLVNNYLKAAVVKGWVRVKELSGNRCTYHLTAKGAAELRQLALLHSRYLDRVIPVVLHEYRQLCRQFKDEGVERVALCGIDGCAELAWLALHEAGIEVALVMDMDASGETLMGREVVSLARAMLSGMYKVLISSRNRADILYHALLDLGTDPMSIKVPVLFLENR
ncbi:MAG: winged helix-turn-helix transcriptional regulator [Trichlorobacter sp.]|uniref:winged helix-turn-helix transcriptional regulator n=1 Tax=Trichlorobacter sp. TaxID=2911007 RepID=UPI002564C31D|nr:winged helix-turn-helix transcriptional regulator [Trichlorobacter sp.]MDK9718580.1 winged helix-turn-helix transcriptional regulator [Trichlorobacter sp.]